MLEMLIRSYFFAVEAGSSNFRYEATPRASCVQVEVLVIIFMYIFVEEMYWCHVRADSLGETLRTSAS